MRNLATEKALREFGHHLQVARKKRKMSQQDFATRVGVSRQTIIRMEKGDPTVSMDVVAKSLLTLGELHRLSEILDPATDDTGLLFDEGSLPKRVRGKNKPKTEQAPEPDSDPDISSDDDNGMGMGW